MKRKVKASVPFEPILLAKLKNPEFAVHYLNSAIDACEDDDFEVFFSILGQIIKAHGVNAVAEKMEMSRDAVYKIFQGHRNPTVKTFNRLLDALDMHIEVLPNKKTVLERKRAR